MRKVIFDCDNSIGIPKKDVDDGLTLLFLLGSPNIELKGITSVFGNSTIEDTFQATEQMLADFKINNIPHHKGAKDQNDLATPAADFLVKMAAESPGEFTLLATGPLTNLKAAYEIDNNFLNNLKEVVLMGGVTDPLTFNNDEIHEVNFTCDPVAAELVIKAELPIALMSGNLCLSARFGEKSWKRVKRNNNKPVRAYIEDRITEWYSYSSEMIGLTGFYMWDVVAAVYLVAPELFPLSRKRIISTVEDLKKGRILVEQTSDKLADKEVINLPATIIDIKRFKDTIFSAWDAIEIVPEGY